MRADEALAHLDEGVDFGPDQLPLLRELGDLKRIRSAGRDGTIATRRFLQGWAALAAGVEPEEVMRRTVASALVAARLGDLDLPKLVELGLTREQAVEVLERAWDEFMGDELAWRGAAAARRHPCAPRWRRGRCPTVRCRASPSLQADQPRAGVTCPGRPRLMLQPAENSRRALPDGGPLRDARRARLRRGPDRRVPGRDGPPPPQRANAGQRALPARCCWASTWTA